jgi:glutamate decarboxylase
MIQRIRVRHRVSRDPAGLLIDAMRRCLEWLRDHPVTSPLAEGEAGGCHH